MGLMGALEGIGKLALGTTEAVGNVGLGATGGAGKLLINAFDKHPGMVIGSALTAGAFGAIAADQDGQADPGRTALKAGTFGLAGAALGGSAAITGVGIATAGAAITGMNALGTIGSSMMRPMTKGEKADKLIKENTKAIAKDTTGKITKLTDKELLAQGAVKGSSEAVDIGLTNLGDFKLNKILASSMIVGAAAIKGIGGGVQAFEKSRMGMNDGMMRRATPTIPVQQQSGGGGGGSYHNNAGATGDLVFSMFKNR